jgi:hypothetical protein
MIFSTIAILSDLFISSRIYRGARLKMIKKYRKSLRTLSLLMISLALLTVTTVSADVQITAPKYTGITIDGQIGDWAGVPGTKITMIQPMTPDNRMVNGLELRVAYDDSNIYVLAIISDDFDYNVTDHHKSAALAVLFAVDEAATPEMGGGAGYVDIWHWELDTGPGVVAGFNLLSGNDPVGNLDDEYALSVFDRHDRGLWIMGTYRHVCRWGFRRVDL